MGKDIRLTRKAYSWETGKKVVVIIAIWRLCTWGYRRIKPVAYHPIALAGITVTVALCIVSPWLVLAALLSAPIIVRAWPETWTRHTYPRIASFLAGFQYRHRPRTRLGGCSVLREKDTIPTISWVTKRGCITDVRLKMAPGHEINWWREEAPRLAQTYNALDCKINPYRREVLNPFKHTMVTKPRWLTLSFLTRDPFNTGLGVEYIDRYAEPDTFAPVIAVSQNGEPERDNLAANKLAVAMSQWGKSTRIRAKVRAHRDKLRKGELEIWGIDGKGGVEQSLMRHVFARVAYGDSEADPDAYNPAEFDKLLRDAVLVMKRRQRRMRHNATHHTPTKKEPWLLIIIDEILVLTNKSLSPELRTSIAASINLIFQQGLACGVSIDASSQLGKKDKLEPIDRDLFNEIEIGKVERGVVDMIFGSGWWERGARADEIADDLKGSFYKKTESTMAPALIRYPATGVDDVSLKALGLDKPCESVLWKPWQPRHLEPVNNPPTDADDTDDEDLESVMVSDNPFGGVA